MNAGGMGFEDRRLDDAEVAALIDEASAGWDVAGRRVLLVIPDLTRSCPLGPIFRRLYDRIAPRAKAFDVLVALGTHPPMTDEQIHRRVGITAAERRDRFPLARFFNHAWDDPSQLVRAGALDRAEIRAITGGLFEMEVPVTCNRMVTDHDLLVILGPVFPHEVVGLSGGNKYIFPGISGPELLNFFHWLGAVITNPRIIGNKQTPVRQVVDRAAALLPIERRALCLVVRGEGLAGLYHGSPEAAWSRAADLSRRVHVRWTDRPFHTVLSCAPEMYDELWVGAKCMYKLEPVVADGGRLIIYAPHLREISVTHGARIRQIGYHTRDYFLQQWERFRHHPWGVLAHSTHVKGIGTFDGGVERPRIEVVLATGIPEADCRAVNLGYADGRSIRPADYDGREDEGVLRVARAGEILYRWRSAPPELGGPEAPGAGGPDRTEDTR
jgi:nickel-dependent lactate racemase